MKTEKMGLIQNEIQEVANRNGIAKWAFCGELKDREFIGMMERKHLTCGSAMLTIINVGRLWQYARQTCRGLLDSYERLP